MSKSYKPTYDVGYKGKATTGESFIVIKYQGRKNITIEFSCGLIRNTTSTNIKQNKVNYCKKRTTPLKLHDTVSNKEGTVKGIVIGVDEKRNRYKIKFENGNIKSYSKGSINSKSISDEDWIKIKKGDVFKTNKFGDVTVTDYIDAHNVHVVFSDGTPHKCQATSLRLGNLGHPTSGIIVGQKFTNKQGVECSVVRYIDPWSAEVVWPCGNISIHAPAYIKSGSIYYKNFKSVTGVGLFGFGKYDSNKSGRTPSYNVRVYESWQRMIRRCYDEKEQMKPSCAAYKNVKVCPEWHNFQNFALWAEGQEHKFVEGWDLDKDMFGDGKLYSPENCCLLPSRVNWFLCDGYSSKKSGLPDGVTISKPNPKFKNAKTGYIARCHMNGKREYLGYFNTPEEAGDAYKKAKTSEAKRLAVEYKSLLTENQYKKLYNFRLTDIHRKGENNE